MPVLTRAQAEQILVRRCGKLLLLVGLDGTTVDGGNPDLNDPLGDGLGSLGLYPASPVAVADADLIFVTPDQVAQILDIAELRCLDSIQGNWDQPNQSAGVDRQDLGALCNSIEKRLDRLTEKCRRLYGYGLGTLTGGVIELDFADTDPTAQDPLYPTS